MRQGGFGCVDGQVVRHGLQVGLSFRIHHLTGRAQESKEILRHAYRRVQDEKFRRVQKYFAVGLRAHIGIGFREGPAGAGVAGVRFDMELFQFHIEVYGPDGLELCDILCRVREPGENADGSQSRRQVQPFFHLLPLPARWRSSSFVLPSEKGIR